MTPTMNDVMKDRLDDDIIKQIMEQLKTFNGWIEELDATGSGKIALDSQSLLPMREDCIGQ